MPMMNWLEAGEIDINCEQIYISGNMNILKLSFVTKEHIRLTFHLNFLLILQLEWLSEE